MFDPGPIDVTEDELRELAESTPPRQLRAVEAIGRLELRELVVWVWLRRVSARARRKSLSAKIHHRVMQAHREGWGEEADRVILWMPTDRICGHCGARVHDHRKSRLYRNALRRVTATRSLGSGGG